MSTNSQINRLMGLGMEGELAIELHRQFGDESVADTWTEQQTFAKATVSGATYKVTARFGLGAASSGYDVWIQGGTGSGFGGALNWFRGVGDSGTAIGAMGDEAYLLGNNNNNLLVYATTNLKFNTNSGVSSATALTLGTDQAAAFTGRIAGPLNAYKTNTATTDATLTAANISGAPDVTLGLTGTLGGDSAATLPLVTALATALGASVAAGQTYRLRIINASSANHVWTVTTNTGWTLTGTMTLAQNTWRDFYVTFTTTSAAVLQNIGTGTYS